MKTTISEPFFEAEPSRMDMTEAYNWYASNKSWTDSKKYIIEYLNKNNLSDKAEIIKKSPEYEISWVCGWIARMMTKGSKVNSSSKTYLQNYIEGIK